MTIRVNAFIPDGEAVQVQFEYVEPCSHRIRIPNSAPAWFRNWAFEAMKSDAINQYGYVPLSGPGAHPWRTGVCSGEWLIRGNNGQLIAVPDELFEILYVRQP